MRSLIVCCIAVTFVFQGLSDPSNYHEFCRLLARLKSNYQLGELVMVENYPEAIQLVAKFTVESLQVCVYRQMTLEFHWVMDLRKVFCVVFPFSDKDEFCILSRCGSLPLIVSTTCLVCGRGWLPQFRMSKRRSLIS